MSEVDSLLKPSIPSGHHGGLTASVPTSELAAVVVGNIAENFDVDFSSDEESFETASDDSSSAEMNSSLMNGNFITQIRAGLNVTHGASAGDTAKSEPSKHQEMVVGDEVTNSSSDESSFQTASDDGSYSAESSVVDTGDREVGGVCIAPLLSSDLPADLLGIASFTETQIKLPVESREITSQKNKPNRAAGADVTLEASGGVTGAPKRRSSIDDDKDFTPASEESVDDSEERNYNEPEESPVKVFDSKTPSSTKEGNLTTQGSIQSSTKVFQKIGRASCRERVLMPV